MSKRDLQTKKLVKAVLGFAGRQHLNVTEPSHEADYEPVRGFMMLPDRHDEAHAAGHCFDSDVQLVVRRVPLPHTEGRHCQRLIVEGAVRYQLPHAIFLSDSHQETDIRHLLAAFHHYKKYDAPLGTLYADTLDAPQLVSVNELFSKVVAIRADDVEFDGQKIRFYFSDCEKGQLDEVAALFREL